MRNFYRTNIQLLIINFTFLIIGFFFYFLIGEKIEILGAILVTGISFSISYQQFKLQDDKIFKELFTSFNSKYDNDFNNTLNYIVKKTAQTSNYQLDDNEIKTIVDYINFCSEEFLWFSKNRIPQNVWKAWQEGMVFFFNCPPINKQFIIESRQENSYYGLFKILKGKVENW